MKCHSAATLKPIASACTRHIGATRVRSTGLGMSWILKTALAPSMARVRTETLQDGEFHPVWAFSLPLFGRSSSWAPDRLELVGVMVVCLAGAAVTIGEST
ncbi:hypothetical protein IQ15_06141 [Bradyrhizobium yuanmingense]|nr:hypothetical protein IQ15_06141 [Bradyrhizobium yuanmingense]